MYSGPFTFRMSVWGLERETPRCPMSIPGVIHQLPGLIRALRGSPPRTRGKGRIAELVGSMTRITPRVRGEKPNDLLDEAMAEGSPPTRAGKSWKPCAASPPHRDHPRTCGEKNSSAAAVKSSRGSPPHARGKVDVVPAQRVHDGISHTVRNTADSAQDHPACAGKSARPAGSRRRPRDHPRVRGEKFDNARLYSAA